MPRRPVACVHHCGTVDDNIQCSTCSLAIEANGIVPAAQSEHLASRALGQPLGCPQGLVAM